MKLILELIIEQAERNSEAYKEMLIQRMLKEYWK